MKQIRRVLRSVRVKMALLMLCLFGVAVGLLLAAGLSAVETVRGQLYGTYRQMVDTGMQQADQSLDDLEQYLLALTVRDYNVNILRNAPASDDAVFASMRVQEALAASLSVNRTAQALFVFVPEANRYLDAWREGGRFDQRESVRAYIRELLGQPGETLPADWFVQQVSGETYILRVVQAGGVYLGAWLPAGTLLPPLAGAGAGTWLAVANGAGEILAGALPQGVAPGAGLESGYGDTVGPYQVMGRRSLAGSFLLVAAVSRQIALASLPPWLVLSLAALAVVVLAIPLLLLYFQRRVARPLDALVQAMRGFGAGDTDTRADTGAKSGEFALLEAEFNQMAGRIQTLGGQVAAEQALRQKAELKHLQLQLNPHFFLNTLSLLHSFTGTGQGERAQQLIEHLVAYFRRMFKSSLETVPLADELAHVDNYIRIQEIRYPGAVVVLCDVPDALRGLPVPALCLLTFVENTVKYQVQAGQTVTIRILAELDVAQHPARLRLEVRDSGTGYPAAVLASLNGGEVVLDEGGAEHIGIWNLGQRLALMYGGGAALRVYNHEADGTGAAAELLLPVPQTEAEA